MNAVVLPRIAMPDVSLLESRKFLDELVVSTKYMHGHRATERLKLLGVLQDLQMLPFEMTAVRDYKRKMARTQRWKLPWNRAMWRMTMLREYDAPIPMEVLDKMHKLSTRMPGLSYFVEYFAREAWEYDGDPFLVIRDDQDMHWVAVWDEPGFKIK